jgi:hypothetical protein
MLIKDSCKISTSSTYKKFQSAEGTAALATVYVYQQYQMNRLLYQHQKVVEDEQFQR